MLCHNGHNGTEIRNGQVYFMDAIHFIVLNKTQ